MMVPDKEWREANSLAGLFQTIVEDCKVRQDACSSVFQLLNQKIFNIVYNSLSLP
jgi:hypothetical protein